VLVQGVVQGVGFRPFVHALATQLRLTGEVSNSGEGVVAEVEGAAEDVAAFCLRVARDAPPLAVVEEVRSVAVPPRRSTGFVIAASNGAASGATLVPPDVATCAACRTELADPTDRRYRHPFISCTDCGPRFTIITGLPYDRPRTTMAGFPMCPRCAAEYEDPTDRRFHAQPVCCPACGPRLELLVAGVTARAAREDAALLAARSMLAQGAIVAVKGLGGYHLACDATDSRAVERLRRLKRRGDKPFAVLVADLAAVRVIAEVGEAEAELLCGPRAPIVLLRRRTWSAVATGVAPGNPDLGVMLPPTGLHDLLLGLPGDPPGPSALVLTSGNLSGEPIVIDDADALSRLDGIADAWLRHDRRIELPCDDSVVRVIEERELPVRRSRGYAPLPVRLPVEVPPLLAVGGDLKNTFCLAAGRRGWLSAHIGDMDDLATQRAFARATGHLGTLLGVAPQAIVADSHPGYAVGRWAARNAAGRPVTLVQHHHAHIATTMADQGLDGSQPVIGLALDGTGYGDDGAVWGGEVLVADYRGYRRFAHLGYVPLAGGDASVRRPYRMAMAHLHAAGLAWDAALPCLQACPDDERRVLDRQLNTGLGCVPTSSMGRLFDAVASLAGVCHLVGYEAQAAIELEAAALPAIEGEGDGYPFPLVTAQSVAGAGLVLDPAPLIAGVVADVLGGVRPAVVAARFHRAVVAGLVDVADAARAATGLQSVALGGGVFVNTIVLRLLRAALEARGFAVLIPRLVPPTDAGIALGQTVIGAARLAADGDVPGAPPDNLPAADGSGDRDR
jgi:hydrogenase maturation protein HypF